MKLRTCLALTGLAVTLLVLFVNSSFAADDKAKAPATASSKVSAAKPWVAAKAKPAPPINLVDINSASKKELTKLPGINDSTADKIIAGRPYLSKAFLVTKNVIPIGTYQSLKTLIIAKQQKSNEPQTKN